MPRNHDYLTSMLTNIDEDRLIALDMALKDLRSNYPTFSSQDAIKRAEVYLQWLTGESKDDHTH